MKTSNTEAQTYRGYSKLWDMAGKQVDANGTKVIMGWEVQKMIGKRGGEAAVDMFKAAVRAGGNRKAINWDDKASWSNLSVSLDKFRTMLNNAYDRNIEAMRKASNANGRMEHAEIMKLSSASARALAFYTAAMVRRSA